MRRTRRSAGVTLVELVIVIVLMAIIVGTLIYFAAPVRQAAEVGVRAELTDVADNALQRIGRDVRLALPNSLRLACGAQCIEFIPVRTAGRYRADGSGAGCDHGADAAGSDELSFDVADGCFKSIGAVPNAGTIVAVPPPASPAGNDYLVLNNYGAGFAGQDAYATVAPLNRAQLSRATGQGTRERINFVAPVSFASMTFNRTLHDSAGRRFYIVTTPVTYECNLAARTLQRWTGYAYGAAYTTGASALIANDVAGCAFEYSANVAGQMGLLTLRLSLSRAVGPDRAEMVTLHHSVHVNNVP